MNSQLILLMTFYVFYISILAVVNLYNRVGAARRGEINVRYYKTMGGYDIPERLVVLGRHFDNQFQLPMLFFVGCCAHMILGKANEVTVGFAAAFVITRLAHSYVHLGRNYVPHRALTYALGWMAIVLLWAQLAFLAI